MFVQANLSRCMDVDVVQSYIVNVNIFTVLTLMFNLYVFECFQRFLIDSFDTSGKPPKRFCYHPVAYKVLLNINK